MKSAIIWLLLSSSTWGSKDKCHFENRPTSQSDRLGNQILVYVEEDRPIFNEPIVTGQKLKKYRKSVKDHTKTEPYHLIERQKAIFERSGNRRLVQLYQDVIDRKIGDIKPINCLESLLLDRHLHLQGLVMQTEFSAAIYKYEVNGKRWLKIIFMSNNRVNGPDLTEEIARENRSVWAIFHNHYFVFDAPTSDIGGTLVPSGYGPPGTFLHPVADLGVFRSVARTFGLKHAWITNGFNTSHFDIEDRSGNGSYWIY